MAQLSWIERRVAATLFGEPPSSTVQDALKNFLKVVWFILLAFPPQLQIFNWVSHTDRLSTCWGQITHWQFDNSVLIISAITAKILIHHFTVCLVWVQPNTEKVTWRTKKHTSFLILLTDHLNLYVLDGNIQAEDKCVPLLSFFLCRFASIDFVLTQIRVELYVFCFVVFHVFPRAALTIETCSTQYPICLVLNCNLPPGRSCTQFLKTKP